MAVLSNLWCPWFVGHVLDSLDLRSAFLALTEEEIQEWLGTLRQKRFDECLPVAVCGREDRPAELIRVAAGDDDKGIAQWTETVVGKFTLGVGRVGVHLCVNVSGGNQSEISNRAVSG